MNNVLDIINKKHWLKRYLMFVLGLLILSVSYNLFVVKCNIIYGGGGIGLIFNKLFGYDQSLVIMVANIILLICSLIFLGPKSTRKTIAGSLLYPFFVKLTSPLMNVNISGMETILVALCASILTGIGLGIIFKAGYTSGGTDILNQIVSKYGKMSIGNAMYCTDFIIILFALLVYDFPILIYSILNLYIVGLITDKVVLGTSSAKAFYIITEHETEVKKFITQNLLHGVTVLEARGGYTGDMKKVIMCIIPTKEYYVFKEGIKMIDEDAFFVVTDAYEVSGGE